MSDTPDLRVTTTPNFNLNLPDVGGDWDLWGNQTNNNWIFLDGALLPIWGGQMTGLLGLSGDPTTPLGAATRQYVDAVSARLGNYVPLAGGAMTGPLQLPPGSAPAPSLQLYPGTGIYGPASGNVAISAAGVLVFSTSSITARFNIPLQVNADPTANLGVATKQYVDAVSGQLGNYLPLTGGQLTGPLITPAGTGGSLLGIGIGNNTTGLWSTGGNALVLQTGGSTNLYLSPTGNQMGQPLTMMGGATLTLAADATQPMQAVTLQQMSAIVGGPYLPIAGGTLTGPLTLAANPTAPLQAATMGYADTKLSLGGGTLTGALTLAADPASALQPVTLQYHNAHTPAASTTNPAMNGAVAVGVGTTWARADHVHPSDTSRLPLTGGAITGTLSVSSTLTAGSLNTGGGLNAGSAAITSGCTAGSFSTGGPISGGTVQATSYFAATVSGWAYTNTGGGASSGTFNFGMSAGSYALAASMLFAVSDRRLKQDITDLSAADGIEWVEKARPVTYVKLGAPGAGFISQEQIAAGYGQYVAPMPWEGLAEETDQAGVTSMADVVLHLDYDNYVAYLTAALKSVLTRLATVETELAALKGAAS